MYLNEAKLDFSTAETDEHGLYHKLPHLLKQIPDNRITLSNLSSLFQKGRVHKKEQAHYSEPLRQLFFHREVANKLDILDALKTHDEQNPVVKMEVLTPEYTTQLTQLVDSSEFEKAKFRKEHAIEAHKALKHIAEKHGPTLKKIQSEYYIQLPKVNKELKDLVDLVSSKDFHRYGKDYIAARYEEIHNNLMKNHHFKNLVQSPASLFYMQDYNKIKQIIAFSPDYTISGQLHSAGHNWIQRIRSDINRMSHQPQYISRLTSKFDTKDYSVKNYADYDNLNYIFSNFKYSSNPYLNKVHNQFKSLLPKNQARIENANGGPKPITKKKKLNFDWFNSKKQEQESADPTVKLSNPKFFVDRTKVKNDNYIDTENDYVAYTYEKDHPTGKTFVVHGFYENENLSSKLHVLASHAKKIGASTLDLVNTNLAVRTEAKKMFGMDTSHPESSVYRSITLDLNKYKATRRSYF